jgi:hypothetical protein
VAAALASAIQLAATPAALLQALAGALVDYPGADSKPAGHRFEDRRRLAGSADRSGDRYDKWQLEEVW